MHQPDIDGERPVQHATQWGNNQMFSDYNKVSIAQKRLLFIHHENEQLFYLLMMSVGFKVTVAMPDSAVNYRNSTTVK